MPKKTKEKLMKIMAKMSIEILFSRKFYANSFNKEDWNTGDYNQRVRAFYDVTRDKKRLIANWLF